MLEKIGEYLKDMLLLTSEVKGLADDVKSLDSTIRNLDRRLIRIETYVDIATHKLLALRSNDHD